MFQGEVLLARRISFVLVAAMSVLSCAHVVRADWPTYRHDAARTGFTEQPLPGDMTVRWAHQSLHAPLPAWPRSDRMTFDRAFQTVIAGGRVVFGSSADGVVRGLDLETGEAVWRFFTDGPIRFAPAVWGDRVFVASDDGQLYALALDDGRLLWKRRGGPDDRFVLGNERWVSKWPVRGGPLVVDDVVYFAAGIWPSDGIYLYALDAATGDVRWCNEDSGALYMPQPHGGANAESGVSAQGYLIAGEQRLFVPTGRAVPAAFDRSTGEFDYFRLQKYGHVGGASAMVWDRLLLNGGMAFRSNDGELAHRIGAGLVAATAGGIVRASGRDLESYAWKEAPQFDRRGSEVAGKTLHSTGTVRAAGEVTALIVAGEQVICGFRDGVHSVDPRSGDANWSVAVEGVVRGLAASDGRLLISTDKGAIYCAGEGSAATARRHAEAVSGEPYTTSALSRQVAEEILQRAGVAKGYCLDLGCGDGALTYELAKRSSLQILAVDDDPAAVASARRRLTAAGLYGSRVTVLQRSLDATGLAPYCANLIVSGRSALDTGFTPPVEELRRLQRPSGGTVCIGAPGALRVTRRGDLAGAGSWTHQYANAANTLNSDDRLVRGSLSMLWFRDVSFDIPQRHGRAPAPLYDRGRLFHEGLDGLVAVDAYNGHELWRFEIPDVLKAYDGDELMGVAGTNSNVCVGDDALFVATDYRCLRLKTATGELDGQWSTPPGSNERPDPWGYLAYADGRVFGSAANAGHVVTYRYQKTTGDMSRLLTESNSLFARNAKTGELLWEYAAAHSIRHNAIAIGDGVVFLVDRPLAMFDRQKKPTSKEHPTGRLVALDARTGNVLWEDDEDVFGTLLALSPEQGVLLMGYQPTRFRLDSEVGGRLAAYRSATGEKLWDIAAEYDSRPLINGQAIYTQSGAWNLMTGEPVPFDFQRSYGCGILAASRETLVFRSATLGYCSFEPDGDVQNFGGIRPGCWINALPAGGLVLVPDATSGCRCSYLNKAWFALVPADGS